MNKRPEKTGRNLEELVARQFCNHGFNTVQYREWIKRPEKYGKEVLVLNAPYNSIFNRKSRTEFLVVSARLPCRVRIECKWQQVPGSVDEKFPYLYLNCIEHKEEHIIILVAGGGASPSAVEWLRDAISRRLYQTGIHKTIELFEGISQFVSWINNTFEE